MEQVDSVIIEPTFCGPPTSGNGGYVCGLLDTYTPYISEVTLRKPPPLAKELQLTLEGELLQLFDGDILIASAQPGAVKLTDQSAPSFVAAEQASQRYIGLKGKHPFPTCFVCGPKRSVGDGLRIFTGPLEEERLFAAPWIPHAALTDKEGNVRSEFLWAALDCPGAFALMNDQEMTLVLGRMRAEILDTVRLGERCVITAWVEGRERRKHFCGTALYGEKGQLAAVAYATWIDIGPNK